MPKKKEKKIVSRKKQDFYKASVPAEKPSSSFYLEYNFLLKTIEAVNSFNHQYRTTRSGTKGGPSTHAQQDLYRAMLIFACAGLDVFVKQLVKTKIPKLIVYDQIAHNKFKEFVKRGLKKDPNDILNTVALALIDRHPREVFLKDYIESMTSESLQSVNELCRVSDASGLNTKEIFTLQKQNQLKDAFHVRNQIIHEMDLNISPDVSKTSRYRTRRERKSSIMEKHTKIILDLAQELFLAYKTQFEDFKIDVAKQS